MDLASINYIAVVVAAVAGFGFGAVYYTVLGKTWMEAVGVTEEKIKDERSAVPFIVSFVSLLLMAAVLSWCFGHRGSEGMPSGGAVGAAVLLWAGFIVTSTATNNAFQGSKLKLTILDCAHWLGVVVIQALVISAF